MERKELFEEIDKELETVKKQDNYESLFKLTKMLNKIGVEELESHKTSLKNARKLLLDFISKLMVLNINILREEITVDKEFENLDIKYTEIYEAVKEVLSEYSQIMNNAYLRPFLLGMLNSLFSAYLNREMIDASIIHEEYNQELEIKKKAMKDIYLASLVKIETGMFCEAHAIGLVRKEQMPPEDASYPSSRLLRIINNDTIKSTNNCFIEVLSYFASITFYNKSKDNFDACLNEFRIIYQMYYPNTVSSINDLIPLLIQMGFPISEIDGKIEIDFDELNNQINIMNESMKEKALIIK